MGDQVRAASIALGIPHTPWNAPRIETMDRLRTQLGNRPAYYREFTEKEPNHSWSTKLWAWGLATGADYLLQLQDDVQVTNEFWPHLRMMLEAVPDQIIGLESVHPVSQMLYERGGSWYTTADGLIGVGYVFPRDVLFEFMAWRQNKLRPGAIYAISEDTMIDVFCMATGRKVWHPVPTIIDHDVSLSSTYGNDHHSHRRPVVTTVRGAISRSNWMRTPITTGHEYTAPHMGRFYQMTPRLCRRWVKDFHMADFERALQDRPDR